MTQELKAAPFALGVLLESGPVLGKRGDNWYVVYVFPRLDRPAAGLSWFRLRRAETLSRMPLELGEDLIGRRLMEVRSEAVSSHYTMSLPERYQAPEHFMGYIGVFYAEPHAEFVEEVAIPKPPGRIPAVWAYGQWRRLTARGWQRYRSGEWVKLL